jgi:hypothetical protein
MIVASGAKRSGAWPPPAKSARQPSARYRIGAFSREVSL